MPYHKEGKIHRNSQKRFYDEGNIYYIVTKTHDNYPYFREPIFCRLLVEELKLCKEMKKFALFGWSIIYDHVNLLLMPEDGYNISQIMKSLKENFSRDANYIITGRKFTGDTATCRLPVRKEMDSFRRQFEIEYGSSRNEIPSFKWQRSFHDHIVRGQKDFYEHYRYTVDNHLKHGLPEDWPFVSENYEETVDYFEM